MNSSLKRDRLILYLSITITYLFLWMHNDLGLHQGKFWGILMNSIWQVIYVVGINLVYFEYILPLVLSKKNNRVLAIILSVFGHLLLFMIGLYAWRELGVLLGSFEPLKKLTSVERKISAVILFSPGTFVLFAVFKLFFDYTRLKFEGQQVHLEKKQAELAFLKSQINPHFLFNTLNNIYSLSQHEPQLVSESVMRLSKLLRYILYEASTDLVTVDKELKVLSDYIDLEKLRYNETVAIEFNYEIDNFSNLIPPLLLLPLVENAFKHGVSQTRGERFVKVFFTLQKQNLYFEVKNSAQAEKLNDPKENIGLSNLRRRLELLYKDFDLVAEHNESTYRTELKINLASHVKN